VEQVLLEAKFQMYLLLNEDKEVRLNLPPLLNQLFVEDFINF